MTATEISLIFSAGILSGVVAVTSGGGATVGIPLMLLLGFAPAESIVSVKVALVASFLTGTLAYKRVINPGIKLPAYLWWLSLFGSIIGANLVLAIAPDALRTIVLVLLVIVLLISFMMKPPSSDLKTKRSRMRQVAGAACLFSLCMYSGFFGAGFGTFLIFALMFFHGYSYLESASVSTKLALLIGVASVTTFVIRDAVNYAVAIPLAVGSGLGGLLGVEMARRGGSRLIRTLFVGVTVLLTLKLSVEVLQSSI